MRRLLICVLLVLCLAGLAWAEEYVSDFSGGTDGWYARSEGGASVAVTDEGLAITGRSATWHSPGRDFDLTPGETYQLSVQVKQEAAPSADLVLSVAHSRDGVESYENIARVTAYKGRWTTLSGTWTAGEYDHFTLYVETYHAPTVDFVMNDFALSRVGLRYDEALPALKERYAPSFDFGTAVTQGEAMNGERMALYARQFGIFTPGNELKPDAVLDVAASAALAQADDTAVAVHFDAALPLLDYAQAHGLKVHGHVLVWHSQTPDVFFREGYRADGAYVSREVMLSRLEHYIAQVMVYMAEHYPGLIVSWDVVNEAIDDTTGQLRQSNWTKVVGDDFVQQAFRIARQYAPEGTLLYYNDYNTPYQPKLDGIRALLVKLQAEGNIDGYGFQAHYALDTPTMAEITTAVERIASLGLRLRVSELDVTIPNTQEATLAAQADKYGQLMALYLAHADAIEAVQVWGVTDDLSWRAASYPLLFDQQMQAKPAFWAVAEAAAE